MEINSKIKVSAVVVTYNRIKNLKLCLNKLLKQSYKINKIIVINNNSDDGTKNYLNELNNPNIIVKNLNKNLGGAGGFNVGTNVAYEFTNSNYFWLMDDDTVPQPDSLFNLIEAAHKLKGNFGFLSSDVRFNDGKGGNCPVTDNKWNELLKYSLIKLKTASFVSLFFKRSTVKKIGLPISEMFIWGDDFEYTSRIRKIVNTNSYFVINSIVNHNSINMDINIINCPLNYLFRYKLMYRNVSYASRKNESLKKFIKLLLNNFILMLKIPFVAKDNKFKRFNAVFLGTINGLFFNPKIEFPRKN